MSGEYEPTLLDVANLLYATSGEGPAPEALRDGEPATPAPKPS
ncbi:MAG TPA: hypothetical protein VGG06_12955 [Thermoanaerobaculia bacterium]|jgi:hypothetical protein